MKFKFSILVALSAALVAGCAAYYSVFGLSQLFAGASLAVIIMASSLEFSKIVAVSFLHRYWEKISSALKAYLLIGVFILVCVTSAGIYGFLSNAYQKTAHQFELSEGKSNVLQSKKELFEKNITDNNAIISGKSTRVQQLTNLRTTQESRLDAATTNLARNRARNDISSANQEIQKLNGEIDVLNTKNISLSDSVSFYSSKMIELKASDDISAEIGPLKYLSQLTGKPMDQVVNWFILLLIFVFDPLAVALVIATNKVIEIENGNSQPTIVRVKEKKKWFTGIPKFFKKKDKPVVEQKSFVIKPEVLKQDPNDYFFPEPQPEPVLAPEPIVEPQVVEPQPEAIQDAVTIVEPVIEPIVEVEPPAPKKDPVIPNGKIEREDIKEIKEKTNRGFSVNIPNSTSNTIQRIGSNKIIKDNDTSRVFFKKRNK